MPTKKKASTAVAVVEDSDWPILSLPEDSSVVQTLADMGVDRFDLDKLVVPAGGATTFERETLEGTQSVREVECIVALAQANQRAFYAASIEDGDGSSPPDCSSEDGVNGFGINEWDVEGLEPEPHDCATCPMNAFESKDRGAGRGKACSEKMSLYAFDAETMIPFVVQVPATSLKPMKKYALRLMGGKKKIGHVVTKLTLEKKTSPMPHAVLNFAYAGALSGEAAKRMDALEGELRTAFSNTRHGGGSGSEGGSNEMD